MATLRDAEANDALDCAAVQVASWKAAYRGMIADDYLDSLSVDDRLSAWEAFLRERGDDVATLVVEDDAGTVRGFAIVRPSHDDPDTGELGATYLHPDAWRQGFGTALLAAAVERARRYGYAGLVLWVHPANVRARAFYERMGWTDDGIDRDDTVWGVTVPERRYSLTLSQRPT